MWITITVEVNVNYLFLPTARDILEKINKAYSKEDDEAEVFRVVTKSLTLSQDSKFVREYFNELKGLWREIDKYKPIITETSNDVIFFRNYIKKDRIYKFLMQLNVENDLTKTQILTRERKLNLDEVISIIQNEKSRRSLMV